LAGTGKFGLATQGSQAFALYFDLVPAAEKPQAIQILLDEIAKKDGHLATGIFGTPYMLSVLSDIGRADIAFKIVNQSSFPGWGYMLENGATTLWEHWAFSDNVYSHNHPMFGSVSQWLLNVIGGIRPAADAVGFDQIILKPEIVGDLTWAKASYNSVRGKISSDWHLSGNMFNLQVEVPVNTTARVVLPVSVVETVTESGSPASAREGVKFVGEAAGRPVYQVGSGTYQFSAEIAL
jgi:alpha-L-rhamnosidase